MSVRLDTTNLATVLLFVQDVPSIKAFPFVSKNARKATLTLKTNPAAFSDSPRDILRLFPNISTMVVRDFPCFDAADALPDTVTAVVVQEMSFFKADTAKLPYADRVVAIRDCKTASSSMDLRSFPRLERLFLHGVPGEVAMPPHKLRHVVVACWNNPKPFAVFPPDCAEQLVFVLNTREAFLEAKAAQLPPNVRVYCNDVGAGVGPEGVYPMWPWSGAVTLSDAFGAKELRAFNERLPLPYRDVCVWSEAGPAELDASFLTTVTAITVSGLKGCALAVPTSVVDYKRKYAGSVFFRLQGTGEEVTIDTCSVESQFDTTVEVLDRCGGASVGFSDDACGVQSLVRVHLEPRREYVVVVGSGAHANDTDGMFRLNVRTARPYANGACAAALPAVPVFIAATANFPAAPAPPAVWFSFAADAAGQLLINTCDVVTNVENDIVVLPSCGAAPIRATNQTTVCGHSGKFLSTHLDARQHVVFAVVSNNSGYVHIETTFLPDRAGESFAFPIAVLVTAAALFVPLALAFARFVAARSFVYDV